jgi:hypothetical protein
VVSFFGLILLGEFILSADYQDIIHTQTLTLGSTEKEEMGQCLTKRTRMAVPSRLVANFAIRVPGSNVETIQPTSELIAPMWRAELCLRLVLVDVPVGSFR